MPLGLLARCGLKVDRLLASPPLGGLESEARSYDVIIADLSGPDVLSVLGELRSAGGDDAPLLLVGDKRCDAAMAFEMGAADFLLWPPSELRLQAAVLKLKERLELRELRARRRQLAPPEEIIWAPYRGRWVPVPLAQISRVEAEGDYVRLHVQDRSYLLRTSLGAFEERFAAAGLIRLRRSLLVRRGAVASVRRDARGRLEVITADSAVFRVGAKYGLAAAEALGVARRPSRGSGASGGHAER
jgi:two-component system response regulator AlgR